MASNNGTKLFTVDKFLGINKSGDGETELKMGEASNMENFMVSDAFNLTIRPGIRRVDFGQEREPAQILASWAGHVGEPEHFVLCDFLNGTDRLFIYTRRDTGEHELHYRQEGALGLTGPEDAKVKIFCFAGKLYVMSAAKTVAYENGSFREQTPYVPLVIIGAAPAGGGTTLENLNLLTSKRRMEFNGDGESTEYHFPEEARDVVSVKVDNVGLILSEAGTYDPVKNVFTFVAAPAEGVGNVEFTYDTNPGVAEENRMRIVNCRLAEAYNGSTDTRLFVAGDGTNLCYYSGVTQAGDATAMYFPAMNEVAVDMSDSPVTGLVRHYSKLLVFKPDGTYTISYEPVTLVDGNTVAGFYLRSANREFGNDVLGQVQTVNNYPRTITKDGIYEWRITSSYYKDERYAQRISDKADSILREADISRIVTCDDNYRKTYYVFLNDDKGTVLVNRYDLNRDGIWCVYRSNLCRNVQNAMMHEADMIFVTGTEAFCFDESVTRDASEEPGGAPQPIKAIWESGFMHFGTDYKRKYSSIIYVSVKPQFNSSIAVTAETDKRDDYMEKTIENNVFQWSNANFPDWTFATNDRPTINRVRLKVKKFVYYKLIFKVEKEGATATILGFDQQVRFASMAK